MAMMNKPIKFLKLSWTTIIRHDAGRVLASLRVWVRKQVWKHCFPMILKTANCTTQTRPRGSTKLQSERALPPLN